MYILNAKIQYLSLKKMPTAGSKHGKSRWVEITQPPLLTILHCRHFVKCDVTKNSSYLSFILTFFYFVRNLFGMPKIKKKTVC